MTPLEPYQIRAIATLARREAGLHLPPSKAAFIAARVQRRLRESGSRDVDEYISLAGRADSAGAAERVRLVSALTTNVTSTFREPHHFDLLGRWLSAEGRQMAVPGCPIWIWSAGCSTGEEPLSIAATCRRVIGARWTRSIRILGTDVDEEVLARARHRNRDDKLLASLANDMRGSVPDCTDLGNLANDLQAGIQFAVHNLLTPPPGERKYHVIFCRNVTIYFAPEIQAQVHASLIGRLATGGLLFLGHSERPLLPTVGLTRIGVTSYRKNGPS